MQAVIIFLFFLCFMYAFPMSGKESYYLTVSVKLVRVCSLTNKIGRFLFFRLVVFNIKCYWKKKMTKRRSLCILYIISSTSCCWRHYSVFKLLSMTCGSFFSLNSLPWFVIMTVEHKTLRTRHTWNHLHKLGLWLYEFMSWKHTTLLFYISKGSRSQHK